MSDSTAQLGLSSVLTKDDDTSQQQQPLPTSAVAAIASRFNAKATDEDSNKVKLSDRVSSLANRFGTTVIDEQQKFPPSPSLRRPTTASTSSQTPSIRQPFNNHVDTDANEPETNDSIIQQSAGNVTNVAKIFDNDHSDISPLNKPDMNGDGDKDEEKTGFLNAHNVFKKAEEAQKNPDQESRVSSFAKMIDSNATSSRDAIEIPPDNLVAGVAKNFDTSSKNKKNKEEEENEKAQKEKILKDEIDQIQVGNVVSKFETAVAKKGQDGNDSDDKEESSENRFANAAKLFESGPANTLTPSPTLSPAVSSSAVASTKTDEPSNPTGPTTSITDTTSNEPVTDQTEDQDDQSLKSRFADAARMFGGS